MEDLLRCGARKRLGHPTTTTSGQEGAKATQGVGEVATLVFGDNCSVHRCEMIDAGYYPRIVGDDRALSKMEQTHCKQRMTVRTRFEREGGEKIF